MQEGKASTIGGKVSPQLMPVSRLPDSIHCFGDAKESNLA